MNREELEKEGWESRSIVDETRVKELVDLYESLGFKIHIEPVRPEGMVGECTECFETNCIKYKEIFTRPGHKIGHKITQKDTKEK